MTLVDTVSIAATSARAVLRATRGVCDVPAGRELSKILEQLDDAEILRLAEDLQEDMSLTVATRAQFLRLAQGGRPHVLAALETSTNDLAGLIAAEGRFIDGDRSVAAFERLVASGMLLDARAVEAALLFLADGHNPGLLQQALGASRLAERDYATVNRLARSVRKLPSESRAALKLPTLKIAVLGEVTTQLLVPILEVALLARGINGTVRDGDFGQVEVLLLDPTSWLHEFRPDVVLALTSTLAVRPDEALDTAALVNRRRELCRLVVDRLGAEAVLTTFEPLPDHTGPQGAPAWISDANSTIRKSLPDRSYVFDLASLVAEVGVDRWFDLRMWGIARQSFDVEVSGMLADRLAAFVRALVEPPIKLIVTDLDDTLWGGIVAEVGAEQVQLGGNGKGVAHVRLQQFLKECVQNGFALAVATKNSPDIARQPFLSHSEMVLTLDDLAEFESSFHPKSVILPDIAKRLNLGLQNVLFLDDSPHERAEMRHRHPEVIVPEWPANGVAGLPALLGRSGWLTRLRLSEEDQQRTRLYQEERARTEVSVRFTDVEAFLDSLRLEARIVPLGPDNLERVLQLIQKTNQFNLTTRRRSYLELEEMAARPGAYARALYLSDRYGSYGLTSVVVALPERSEPSGVSQLVIDTWVMSCRIMGKSVERAMFADLLRFARESGYASVVGIFSPTAKNSVVNGLYEGLGLSRDHTSTEKEQRFTYEVGKESLDPSHHVRILG